MFCYLITCADVGYTEYDEIWLQISFNRYYRLFYTFPYVTIDKL